ncbi:acyltransferase [Thalassospiraceae bacterium SW-3-3]|nr:acyltransferase [Thalassospiraceae bacterium SW-3-3]
MNTDKKTKKTPINTNIIPQDHSNNIDFLRGSFAIFVLIGHAFDVSFSSAIKDGFIFTFLAEIRIILGFVWVCGFVVISGFCIELSCSKNDSKIFDFIEYARNRISRIFPLLFVCVSICLLFDVLMLGSPNRPNIWETAIKNEIDLKVLALNYLGLGGFYLQFGSIAPAYTISYELLYYAIWGITRFLLGRKIGLGLAINAFFASAYVITFALNQSFNSPINYTTSPFIVMIYLPWLIGAATARYYRKILAKPVIKKSIEYSPIILILWIFISARKLGQPSFSIDFPTYAYYIITSILFSGLIIRSISSETPRIFKKFTYFLGEISFPLYLVHGPAIIFTCFLLNRLNHNIPFTLHISTLILTSLICAHILVILVERPVMNIRRKYRG